MRKLFNVLLCFILCFMVYPNFSNAKNKSFAEYDEFVVETSISHETDIIGINNDDMDYLLRSDAVLNQNPYNNSTNIMMNGYSICPSADDKNQIKNKFYNVKNFQIDENSSVFMWIYLPDNPYTNYYKLTINFYDEIKSSYLGWEFTYNELYNLIPSISTKYGWKLFEFSAYDATTSRFSEETTFSQMKIEYYFEASDLIDLDDVQDYISKTNGKLSIYHAYVGESKNNETGIISELAYYKYKVKEEFKNKYNLLCLNDEFVLDDLNDIFEFVFVGKYNLLLMGTQNSNFEWSFNIQNDGGKTDLNVGYCYKMAINGWNYLNINLNETRSGKQILIINEVLKNSVSEFNFGSFTKYDYNISAEDTFVINFKLSSNFSINGNLTVTSSDEDVLKINSCIYDLQTKSYVIQITGLKKGKANIVVSAKGSRSGYEEKTFEVSTLVKVDKKSSGFLSKKTIFTIIIFYGVAIIVFGSFTFINFKRAKKIKNEKI